jgi:hypothetical protein
MQNSSIYTAPPPLAYDVAGLAKSSGRCRSIIFEDIAAGRLTARKAGGKLVILYDDAKAWLHNLPVRAPSKVEAVSDAS